MGFLSIAGGIGSSAANLAAKYIDEDMQKSRDDLLHKYRLDEQENSLKQGIKFGEMQKNLDDDRLFDPVRNARLMSLKNQSLDMDAARKRQEILENYGTDDSPILQAIARKSKAENAASIETAKMHNEYLQDALKAKYESGLLSSGKGNRKGNDEADLLDKVKQIDNTINRIDSSGSTTQADMDYRQELVDQQRAIYKSLLEPRSQSTIPSDTGDYDKYGLTKQEANKAISRNYDQYRIDEIAKQKGVDANFLKGMLNSESSMSNPNQQSSAGAKGPFQFIDGTWTRYADKNMGDVNNPVHAANAAANYVKKMGEQDFNGNLALVAAGYNAGEGRVKAAINQLNKENKDITTENIMSLMPRETQAYVPKVLAYKEYLDNLDTSNKIADSGQIQSDAKPIESPKVEPKSYYLNNKIQQDAQKELSQADNPLDRQHVFRQEFLATGDYGKAINTAMQAAFDDEGNATLHGKPYLPPVADKQKGIADEILAKKLGSKSVNTDQNSNNPNASGFDENDIKRINKFPDIVQQAIVKSDDPKKVLDTFEKNNFDLDSIKKDVMNALTASQRKLFERMTAEQQKEFITNPDVTFDDYKPTAPFYSSNTRPQSGLSKK